jgi:hypothetical protein
MAKNIKVCDDWHGNAQEDFNFVNHSDQDANVSALANQTWPFVQSSPIFVPKKANGQPGSTACQLKNLSNNTYPYTVDICPTGGAPKTVTIP